jgi:hypothetical protein
MRPSWWLDRTRGARAAVVLREDRDIFIAFAAFELRLDPEVQEVNAVIERSLCNRATYVVRTFQNKFEAEMAQGTLEATEMSIVSADGAGGMRPDRATQAGRPASCRKAIHMKRSHTQWFSRVSARRSLMNA